MNLFPNLTLFASILSYRYLHMWIRIPNTDPHTVAPEYGSNIRIRIHNTGKYNNILLKIISKQFCSFKKSSLFHRFHRWALLNLVYRKNLAGENIFFLISRGKLYKFHSYFFSFCEIFFFGKLIILYLLPERIGKKEVDQLFRFVVRAFWFQK